MTLEVSMITKAKWQRVQVLLPPDQYRALRERAARQRVSMGALVREALSRELNLPTREERLAAVERMGRMDLPVADWRQMKREILEAQLEPHGFDPSVLVDPQKP